MLLCQLKCKILLYFFTRYWMCRRAFSEKQATESSCVDYRPALWGSCERVPVKQRLSIKWFLQAWRGTETSPQVAHLLLTGRLEHRVSREESCTEFLAVQRCCLAPSCLGKDTDLQGLKLTSETNKQIFLNTTSQKGLFCCIISRLLLLMV